MKNFFYGMAAIAAVSMPVMTAESAMAADFEVPEARIIVPLGGQAEILTNMFAVTWGYYGLTDNSDDDPIEAALTFPDGTTMNVKGSITDANGVETGDVKEMPADYDNALMFRNFMEVDMDNMQLIQQYGTYRVAIPEGVVLVNGVPNPAANLSFTVTGIGGQTMLEYGSMVTPAAEYVSSCLSAIITWGRQEITLDETTGVSVTVGGEPIAAYQLEMYLTDATEADDPGIATGSRQRVAGETLNALVINFPISVFGKTGDFVIGLPEGLVSNSEGLKNPKQTFTIHVLPLTDVVPTITPDCPNYGGVSVNTLETVTLSWGMPVSMNQPCEVRFDLPDGGQTYMAAENLIGLEGDETIVLNVAGCLTGNGEYAVVVPQDAFILQGEEAEYLNGEGYYRYIVTDVSNVVDIVEASEGRFEVYGTDGVKLLSTDSSDDLRSLVPGKVYIVNGKKIYLKNN